MPLSRTDSTVPYYSICPVFVASHIALAKGFLEQEFNTAGGALRRLHDLPEDIARHAHYRHTQDYQFRDGGNIPAISAKAEHADSILLGSTFVNQGGQILVRTDSGINRIQQLRGRRIGLPRNPDPQSIDWWRANALRSIRLALELYGLGEQDVEWRDIPQQPTPKSSSHSRNAEPTLEDKIEYTLTLGFTPEFQALARGEVDAIYTTQGRAEIYQRSGRYKVIEDLSRSPDWTLHIAATPYTLTASRKLAEEQPELLVAYLRANIRAARWAKENPLQAAHILYRNSYDATPEQVLQHLHGIDLTPSLSEFNLSALDLGKQFLLENGFIHHDVDVRQWAEPQWLQAAFDSL